MKKIITPLLLLIFLPFSFFGQEPGWIDKGDYMELDTNFSNINYLETSLDGEQFYTFSKKDSLFTFWDLESGSLKKSYKIFIQTSHIPPYGSLSLTVTGANVNYNEKYIILCYTKDIGTVRRSSISGIVELFDYNTGEYTGRWKALVGGYSYSENMGGKRSRLHFYSSDFWNDNYYPSYHLNEYTFQTVEHENDYFAHSLFPKNKDFHLINYCELREFNMGTYRREKDKISKLTLINYKDSSKHEIFFDKGFDYYHQDSSERRIDHFKRLLKMTFMPLSERIAGIVLYEGASDSLYTWKTSGELISKIDNVMNPDYFTPSWNDEYFLTSIDGKIYTVLVTDKFMSIVDSSDFQYPEKKEWRIIALDDKESFLCVSNNKLIRYYPEFFSNILKCRMATESDLAFAGEEFYCYDYSTGEPDSRLWDFGDGSTSTEQNPQHIYQKEGEYTVTLTVEKDGKKDSQQKVITVEERQQLAFSADAAIGEAPMTVQFQNESRGTFDEITWHFGDGDSSTAHNPIHTYDSAGIYGIRLQLRSEHQQNTLVKDSLIEVFEPMQADFEVSGTIGIAPFSVTFTDLTSGNPDSYFWDLGDGTTSNDKNIVHEYKETGLYEVSLTVENKLKSDKKIYPEKILVINNSIDTTGNEPINETELFLPIPNPADEYILITNIDTIKTDMEVEIFNYDGTRVYYKIFPHVSHKDIIRVNTYDLPLGAYFIRIRHSIYQTTRKIMIQH